MLIQLNVFMGLFGTNTHKHSEELALVFDIGSGNVGGALVVLDQVDIPRVLYSARAEIPFQKDIDFERFFAGMLSAFDVVVNELQRKGMQHINRKQEDRVHIKRALCVYASPWYASHTKVLKRTDENSFRVDQDFIDMLVAQEQKNFQDGQVGVNSHGHVVEQKITSIELNGYPTHDISVGRDVQEVRVTMTMTMIADAVITALEKRLQEVFTVPLVDHHSFGMAGFTVLRNMYPDLRDFMFIDVGAEVTDIIICKNDALLDTISFPLGKNYILRKLSEVLDSDAASIESFLHDREHIHADSRGIFEEALKDIQNEWRTQLNEAIHHTEHEVAPEAVFYITDDVLTEVIGAFVESEYAQIHKVQAVTLRGGVVHFNTAITQDPFIGIDAVYCNTLFKLS